MYRNHTDYVTLPAFGFQEGDFDWNERAQSQVLGAFYIGYTLSNFPGGRAAEYLGGRLVLGLTVMVPSFLSLFSALCASVSKDLFIVLRVLEGLTQVPFFLTAYTCITATVIGFRGLQCMYLLSHPFRAPCTLPAPTSSPPGSHPKNSRL